MKQAPIADGFQEYSYSTVTQLMIDDKCLFYISAPSTVVHTTTSQRVGYLTRSPPIGLNLSGQARSKYKKATARQDT